MRWSLGENFKPCFPGVIDQKIIRKILAPIKIKSALPPPQTPPQNAEFYGHGFSCRKNEFFPGVHKIGAAIAGPRIADTNFTDTRIFLKLATQNPPCYHRNHSVKVRMGRLEGYGRQRLSPEFRATRLWRREKKALSGSFLLVFQCLRPKRVSKNSARNPGYQWYARKSGKSPAQYGTENVMTGRPSHAHWFCPQSPSPP